MSFMRFLFPRPFSDDTARARALQQWLATGVVPVAHMVADLGAMGEATGEFERPRPAAIRAGSTFPARSAHPLPSSLHDTSCHRPCRLSPQTCACVHHHR
jgi:hypothetical protein